MINLTPRQASITTLVAQGLSAKQIAALSGITENTARVTLQQARERVGARTLAQLVAMAISRGWIAPLLLALTISAISPDVHMQRLRSSGGRQTTSITKLNRRQESHDLAGVAA